MNQCLPHLKVLDLSRVFAGPWATQMLADLGANVIKVERPGRGDDVRQQGFKVKNKEGRESRETSSFFAMNRGKRSIAIDISKAEGQELIRKLAAQADVLVENYKVGDLVRYGLDYESLRKINPRLVYCSITGFGQTGPYRALPGYDPIFQSMSGLMSLTGLPDGVPGAGPQKVGYAVSDMNAGFYASFAILAALNCRDNQTGEGQHIDVALLDAQIAALSHVAMNYLVSGKQPERVGSASEITCPYQAFICADGDLMLAVGNDSQFRQLVKLIDLDHLADDSRFVTNPMRAQNRAQLVPQLQAVFLTQSVKHWNTLLGDAGIPCGPINNFEQVFQDPQVIERQVLFNLDHPVAGSVKFIANPVRLSGTPVKYKLPPPLLGQHTHEILKNELQLSDDEISAFEKDSVIQIGKLPV